MSLPPPKGWVTRYAANVLAYCWRYWRRRPLAWLATAVAVGGVLSLAAGAELFLVLAERSLGQQVRSASEFQVFLADDAKPEQVNMLEAKIDVLPGVRAVHYRSKAEALRLARQDSSLAGIAESTSNNPFPASLVVEMSGPAAAREVAAVAARDPATDHQVPTSYSPAQAQRLSGFLSMAQAVVAGFGLAALAVAALVALVLIRSDVRARRAELRILSLVGTPRPVIRLPVLVEAVTLAVLGSLIAGLVLLYVGGHVVPLVNGYLPFLQLGDAGLAVGAISLATLVSSVVALGGCSMLVRLPR